VLAVAGSGCGSERIDPLVRTPLDASRIPPIGASARHHPGSLGAAAARGRPVGRLRCARVTGERHGIHIELFGAGQTVIVPAGIGIAPPRRVDGAYVRSGRCSYPLRTTEPTGVVEVAPGSYTLRDLFAVWGRSLGPREMAGWRGPVRAFVGGRAWRRDPGTIPLRRHAQIVLVVGRDVPVHARYRFPPGL
jgi:hypothetical protein